MIPILLFNCKYPQNAGSSNKFSLIANALRGGKTWKMQQNTKLGEPLPKICKKNIYTDLCDWLVKYENYELK